MRICICFIFIQRIRWCSLIFVHFLSMLVWYFFPFSADTHGGLLPYSGCANRRRRGLSQKHPSSVLYEHLLQCRLDKASQCYSFEWPAVPSCWRSPARAWPRPRTWPTWSTATAGSSTSPPPPYGVGKVSRWENGNHVYFGNPLWFLAAQTHNNKNVFLQETPITRSTLQTK